jgi:hypothetical protein
VRFGIKAVCVEEQGRNERVHLRYVCERDHRPIEHGILDFDVVFDAWRTRHADARVQRMAECYLAAYFERKKNPAELVAS